MRLDGVLPPIPTPFAGDRVDEAAMRANVARWMGTRVRGVVVLGSNGEAPLLDEAESDAAIAAAREQVPPDRLCLAGTGRESTVAAVRRSGRRLSAPTPFWCGRRPTSGPCSRQRP